MTRVALDSNILVYLAGLQRVESDRPKIDRARQLVAALPQVGIIAPVQALGECFVVLCKGGAPTTEAREIVQRFAEDFGCPASGRSTALAAADLVVDHKLQYWDAMIVSAAADAGCAILLSEDMQHGFVTRGLTVVDPFAEPMHEKLARLLAQ